MTALDAAIVLAFVAYAVTAGQLARRRASRGLEDYVLAGRGLRGWQAGMSMTATQFAADTPLVVTGLLATSGLFALWQLWSYGVAFLLLGFLFAPSWRRARVLTDAELAELRYGGRGATLLRGVRALLFGLVFNAVVVAMVLLAATVFAERLLPWHLWLPSGLYEALRQAVEASGVVLTGTADPALAAVRSTDNAISLTLVLAVTFLYATTGGLRSVVATDVVQLVLMLGATAWYAVVAVDAAGGLEALPERLGALAAQPGPFALRPEGLLDLGPGAPAATAGLVLLFAMQWLLQRNADGTGYLAQRAMACRTDAEARRASVLFAFLQIVLRSWLWVPLGLALLVLYPPAPELAGEAFTRDREATFVTGMGDLLPPGVLGVMLAGMLAALASTLDTHLNWGASYLANDLYGRLWCGVLRGREAAPRTLVRVARLSNAVLVAVAVALIPALGSIQAAWKLTLVLGAGIGVVTVMRWLWWRVTAWGELAGLAVAFAATPPAVALAGSEPARMLLLAAASGGAAVAVSLLGPRERPERLRAFVARAAPPGFWGPYDDGRARRALARGLGATAAAAVSLYGLLLAGLWLGLGSAPVPYAPALALVAAAVAGPFWIPALRTRSSAHEASSASDATRTPRT